MLTVSTPVPTSLRGQVRALVKAHASWPAFLAEKAIISAGARNADLLEFALRHPALKAQIGQMLADHASTAPAGSAATLMLRSSSEAGRRRAEELARRIEKLLATYAAAREAGDRKPRIRVKAVSQAF